MPLISHRWLDYRTVIYANISPKMVNLTGITGNAEEEEEEFLMDLAAIRLSVQCRITPSVKFGVLFSFAFCCTF